MQLVENIHVYMKDINHPLVSDVEVHACKCFTYRQRTALSVCCSLYQHPVYPHVVVPTEDAHKITGTLMHFCKICVSAVLQNIENVSLYIP